MKLTVDVDVDTAAYTLSLGDDRTVIWLTAPVATAQLLGCLLATRLIDS